MTQSPSEKPKPVAPPFILGPIEGVVIRPLKTHRDERGWLAELFRRDELTAELFPAMSYASITRPGAQRGPHEHADQTDYFCFFGPSTFRMVIWDNRDGSPTRGHKISERVGEERPAIVIVPPGVVHAYKNVGAADGLVINGPNRLYAGERRKDPVDEIRHEKDPGGPFRFEEEDR